MIIQIDKVNQKIKVLNSDSYLPRSVSVITGILSSGMNKKNQITLKNVKFGIVVDKSTLKIKYADLKDNKLLIQLNEENFIPFNKNEKLRFEFNIVKQNDIGKNNYEKTYKKATFKITEIKDKNEK